MSSTSPKPFAFVLMPFDESFDDIYEVGIKQACKDANAYCERVDKQIFQERIIDRIYNQISKADIIIADMSGRNPNVFYEVGYAHALDKGVILLTQNAQDIPFDLKHYPHIIYKGKISVLKSELEERIRWFIANPISSSTQVEFPLNFYIDGQLLSTDNTVLIEKSWETRVKVQDGEYLWLNIDLKIDIHNPKNILFNGNYELGLVTNNKFVKNFSDYQSIKTPANEVIHLTPGKKGILPGSWKSSSFIIRLEDTSLSEEPNIFEWRLRVFTEIGVKEYPFEVKCLPNPEFNIDYF